MLAGDRKTIRVHVPFPMADQVTCKEKFGHFSEDPSQFVEEFTKLTMSYELTWDDLQVLLSTRCTFEEKSWILGAAWAHANELAMRNQGHIIYITGGDEISSQDPLLGRTTGR